MRNYCNGLMCIFSYILPRKIKLFDEPQLMRCGRRTYLLFAITSRPLVISLIIVLYHFLSDLGICSFMASGVLTYGSIFNYILEIRNWVKYAFTRFSTLPIINTNRSRYGPVPTIVTFFPEIFSKVVDWFFYAALSG